MGDPGSIVGTISLGLQLVQGVSKYYTRFSSYSEDIAAVIVRTERLEAILRVLEGPIQRLQSNGDSRNPITEETRSCLAACLTAISNLEQYQRKCTETRPAPDAFVMKMLKTKKQLEFPFRKDSLEDLQKILDRLLENIVVILQALQL
jgi:hypothetical protein